ncbi:DUF5076 domain-containing protein [Xanthomonas citri]|uniref:DUF5076 domain-containing protein n=1 Tax=Xanthomonas citri TaxID=346 RepID=UPI001E29937C|nr:DUF5076 domain-containing protein [Xanthomonas citri]MCC8490704.1 DUF5076 domain-containing protein [Xanthomonas citri pv. fuscans]
MRGGDHTARTFAPDERRHARWRIVVPPGALADPEAFELLRLWAANEQLQVSINRELGGGAENFGELLADLFEHASRRAARWHAGCAMSLADAG